MKRNTGFLFLILMTLLAALLHGHVLPVSADDGTQPDSQAYPDSMIQVSNSSTVVNSSVGSIKLYLPMTTHSSQPRAAADCELSDYERQLADLMINDPGQQRVSLHCDPTLAQVAHEKAVDMANRKYFGHVDPDGYGPNFHVEEAGYLLPNFYDHSTTANNIESIAAGYATPSLTWNAFINSPYHRPHVLGEDPFFREQIDYGIGYYYLPGSPYQYYWVIVTARH